MQPIRNRAATTPEATVSRLAALDLERGPAQVFGATSRHPRVEAAGVRDPKVIELSDEVADLLFVELRHTPLQGRSE